MFYKIMYFICIIYIRNILECLFVGKERDEEWEQGMGINKRNYLFIEVFID